MEAKKQLRKPESWEAFESLCKKLWGEIWDCKEIKKNGRKGQVQNGVDVYGVPKGEKAYYGIQCKGKDEYSHKQLTEHEIDREINLAKLFTPPLAKLYFATTANKDSKIEEYVRIKDLENRKEDSFEVHLFSWEDIVDLIDENRETHDWYLNLQKFKGTPDVLVCFENDENELIGSVPFCEQYTYFMLGTDPADISIFNYTSHKPPILKEKPLFRKENKSYFRFRLKIINTGSTPIENPKLVIQIKGKYKDIDDENFDFIVIPHNARIDVEINKEQGIFSVVPRRSTFALEEEYISSEICVKPNLEGGEIELSWKLISNNYNKQGLLRIKINTYLIRKEVNKYVDFRQHVRVEKNIVDYIQENQF